MDDNKTQIPFLIYDGDCGFCRRWIVYWQGMTGPCIRYLSSQEFQQLDPAVQNEYPLVKSTVFEKSVVLVYSNGDIFTGALAVLKALGEANHLYWAKWLLTAYARVPGFSRLIESCYSLVALHR